MPYAEPRCVPAHPRSVELAASEGEIRGNVFDLSGPVGEHVGARANATDDVRDVQLRLVQLGVLGEHDYEEGVMGASTTAAIEEFQRTHSADIGRIRDHARGAFYAQPTYGTAGTRSTPGAIVPGDATHQALAQAWPREINGTVMTEAQAYEYLSRSVVEAVGRFDPSEVNVVGVRAYQGGGAHGNPHVREFLNHYDDEMFVLYMDGDEPRVRSYRATVDPGGASPPGPDDRPGTRTVPRGEQDMETWIVHANQQLEYVAAEAPDGGTDVKHARPSFWMPRPLPVVRSDGEHSSIIAEHGRSTTTTASYTVLHSGVSGDLVRRASAGCQVVHGNWYADFREEVYAHVGPDRRVTYTLLDGRELPDPERPAP